MSATPVILNPKVVAPDRLLRTLHNVCERVALDREQDGRWRCEILFQRLGEREHQLRCAWAMTPAEAIRNAWESMDDRPRRRRRWWRA